MIEERKKKAIDAFERTFPHLSDSTSITNVWLKAVEWADKHNELVDIVKKYIGMEEPAVNHKTKNKGV